MITASTLELSHVRDHLPLAADARCVFVSGSQLEGWGHANSDLDLYVVADDVAAVEAHIRLHVRLVPDHIKVTVSQLDGNAVDTEFWMTSQVEQILAKVTPGSQLLPSTGGLSPRERDFMWRLAIARPLSGGQWLAERKAELAASQFRRRVALEYFESVDGYLDDAVGMVRSGDFDSAVLAAQLAFGNVVDGVCAHYGELSPSPKWRARRVRRAGAAELPFDDYWAVVTMRDYDPDNPGAWVMALAARCQNILMEVDL